MSLLQQALDKVTYKDCIELEEGTTLCLNDKYGLYFYEAGESMVIQDLETYDELYWVQYDSDTETVEFGEL